MKSIFTATGIFSAAALVGWAGIPQSQANGTQPAEGPMSCCTGSRMMSMMQTDDAPATRPVEQIDLTAQQQAEVDRLTEAYLDVRAQLADDDVEGVTARFETIRTAAKSLSEAENARLKQTGNAIAKAADAQPEDLEAAREAYKPLSEAVIRLAQLAPPSDDAAETLYEAYCPMAKAAWLQTSKEIANPYMGQSMLKCGELRATLKDGNEQ